MSFLWWHVLCLPLNLHHNLMWGVFYHLYKWCFIIFKRDLEWNITFALIFLNNKSLFLARPKVQKHQHLFIHVYVLNIDVLMKFNRMICKIKAYYRSHFFSRCELYFEATYISKRYKIKTVKSFITTREHRPHLWQPGHFSITFPSLWTWQTSSVSDQVLFQFKEHISLGTLRYPGCVLAPHISPRMHLWRPIMCIIHLSWRSEDIA